MCFMCFWRYTGVTVQEIKSQYYNYTHIFQIIVLILSLSVVKFDSQISTV